MKDGVISQKVKLRSLRLKMGLTQQELADSLGMNSRYISMVESEKKPCSDKLLQKVELLSQTKNCNSISKSFGNEKCPRCSELETELADAREIIKDLASSLAAALVSKPTMPAGHASGANYGANGKPKERQGA